MWRAYGARGFFQEKLEDPPSKTEGGAPACQAPDKVGINAARRLHNPLTPASASLLAASLFGHGVAKLFHGDAAGRANIDAIKRVGPNITATFEGHGVRGI